MVKLLSVDWDYFFPDFDLFGWLEIRDPFFAHDMIWPIRYSSKLIDRNIIARDFYNPVWFYKQFWDYVLTSCPKMVFIFDELESIGKVLKLSEGLTIYHFDQHKNGFESIFNQYSEKITNLELISSNWEDNDFKNKGKLLNEFKTGFPNFDMVFVYRNPTFTSSWNDQVWLSFLELLFKKLDKHCLVYREKNAIEKREFDYQFAFKWLHEQQVFLERQRVRRNNGYVDSYLEKKGYYKLMRHL